MNLYEAKVILENNGYILKESSEFVTKWYKNYTECKDIVETFIDKLEDSVKSHIPDDGNYNYVISYYNNKSCGILKASLREDEELGIEEPIPFIWEVGTTGEIKGAGAALVQAFIKKYGENFWCKCLDKTAENFWKYMAKKFNIQCEQIAETPWKTAILYFG